MTYYKKKPVVIQAFRYGFEDPPEWLYGAVSNNTVFVQEKNLVIVTLEGNMLANLGDWIIKGLVGELYPCKHDIFLKTYEQDDTGEEFAWVHSSNCEYPED